MPNTHRPRRFVLVAAVTLVLALAACGLRNYGPEDFVGAFEDGEGAALTLWSDGTAMVTGLSGDDTERTGAWSIETNGSQFVSFFYDEQDLDHTNLQFWIDSDEKLHLGGIHRDPHYFERASDESSE